jgi:preprotein translocase subunit SecG
MRNLFNIITVISATLLTVTILLQSRGAGLGRAFGGEGNVYRSKRGAEKIIYNTTIVTGVIFVMSVILGILSKR